MDLGSGIDVQARVVGAVSDLRGIKQKNAGGKSPAPSQPHVSVAAQSPKGAYPHSLHQSQVRLSA